jgi:hypothetical protein
MKAYDHEIFKTQYYHELERKKELDSIITFPVTIETILIGSTYIISKEYIEAHAINWISILILIVLLIFTYFTIKAIIHLVKLFHDDNRRYLYIPYSSTLNEYVKQLNEYREGHEVRILNDFNNDLFHYYIDCGDHNAKINDEREIDYADARKYIVYCAITFIILSLVIIIDKAI